MANFNKILQKIRPEHTAELKAFFSLQNARAWCCFTPYLYHTSEPGKNRVYWICWDDSIFIFYRRVRKEKVRWDILTFASEDDNAICNAVKLMDKLNSDRRGRILWLPERYCRLAGKKLGFSFEFRDREYFYDSAGVSGMCGKGFADLRKSVNRFLRENHTCVVDILKPEHIDKYLDFLGEWEDSHITREYEKSKQIGKSRTGRNIRLPVDRFYTLNAIKDYGIFKTPDLSGWILSDQGKVLGIALAGEMLPRLANFFILKTDAAIYGAGAYLRWYVIKKLFEQGYSLINDASDLNMRGLEQHKRKFRPVEFLPIYKGTRE